MSTLPIVETLRRERRCFTCNALSTDVARLEAADTIEALYGALGEAEQSIARNQEFFCESEFDPLIDMVRAALAKARGERPDA